MHPHIKMDKPGKCPICAMDLIPLSQSGGNSADAYAIHFTKEAAQLANVMTSLVSKQQPVKEVRLYGKIQADERLRLVEGPQRRVVGAPVIDDRRRVHRGHDVIADPLVVGVVSGDRATITQVMMNLLTDLTYGVLDPRIRLG